MRAALIVSLLLAIAAVVFALQNPGTMEVNLGPFDIQGSTALILMVTFFLGVVVGILATVPSIVKRRKRLKTLEHSGGTTSSLEYEDRDYTIPKDYRSPSP